jgi:predicted Zn-dependent peptidase
MASIFNLSNGIKCIYEENDSYQAATIIVMFNVGSRDEPKSYHGLTHFIEHLFFKGTEKRPKSVMIASNIDKYGAEFNATTDYDITDYFIKIDKKHFEVAVEMLSDMLFHSLFRSEDIQTESSVVINELQLNRSNPSKHIIEMAENLVYTGTDLEHNVGGSDEVIKAATRSQFMKYIKKYYQPENAIISITGDLGSHTDLKKLLEKYFNKDFKYKNTNTKTKNNKNHNTTNHELFKSRNTIKNFISLQKNMRFDCDVFPKVSNAHICICFPGTKYYDKDYHASMVLHSIIGANMSSRLFMSVREKHGLTYNIRSGMSNYKDLGNFFISYGTNNDLNSIQKTFDLIFDELHKLKTILLDKDELNKGKEYLIGKDIIQRANSNYTAKVNCYNYLYLDKYLSQEEIYKMLRKVTNKDIQKVANDILQKNKLNIAIISKMMIKESDINIKEF